MKKIIDGKLYDTEKAEVIFEFTRKYREPISWAPDYAHVEWVPAKYLKTAKGAWLYYCGRREDLQLTTEEAVKRTIKKLDPDRYMELFGEVEEG